MTQQLVDAGVTASDLEVVLARLPRLRGTLKLTVVSRPPPSKMLTVDEPKLEKMLRAAANYRTDAAVRHDLDAIPAIHRLRKGEKRVRLERCLAVFVTTNFAMIDTDREFFRQEYALGGVPRCYSDNMFETLIWLKKPLRAPDLPRRRILADCLAALRPSEELWLLYVEEIERLRDDEDFSEDDVVLLKNSLEAKVELMEVTLGETAAFGEGTIQEVLQRARANVQGEAAKEISALKAELEQSASSDAGQLDLFNSRANKIARRTSRVLLYGVTAAMFVVGYLTLPSNWNGLSSHLERVIAPLLFGAFVLLGALSILNLMFGTSVQAVLERFEKRLERRLVELQLRIAGRV